MNRTKIKTFKMDDETEAKLVALAEQDERSQSGEVRYLILSEYERRQVTRVAAAMRDPKVRFHPDADTDECADPDSSCGE